MSEAVLLLDNIQKKYATSAEELRVLNGATLSVAPGEVVALVGPSGSGKSTMLHIAGLLDGADSGQIIIQGRDCAAMSDAERTRVRREDIGFVYQFHNLLPEFTALENVVLPQMIAGTSRKQAEPVAKQLLESLGLGGRLEHVPSQLSGGEQQRVAIARALANGPKVLLADEPTGNLDEGTADKVFDELLSLSRERGVAALIATHNMELASRMDRRIVLHNGQVEEE